MHGGRLLQVRAELVQNSAAAPIGAAVDLSLVDRGDGIFWKGSVRPPDFITRKQAAADGSLGVRAQGGAVRSGVGEYAGAKRRRTLQGASRTPPDPAPAST